jgi:hypothetical protein
MNGVNFLYEPSFVGQQMYTKKLFIVGYKSTSERRRKTRVGARIFPFARGNVL